MSLKWIHIFMVVVFLLSLMAIALFVQAGLWTVSMTVAARGVGAELESAPSGLRFEVKYPTDEVSLNTAFFTDAHWSGWLQRVRPDIYYVGLDLNDENVYEADMPWWIAVVLVPFAGLPLWILVWRRSRGTSPWYDKSNTAILNGRCEGHELPTETNPASTHLSYSTIPPIGKLLGGYYLFYSVSIAVVGVLMMGAAITSFINDCVRPVGHTKTSCVMLLSFGLLLWISSRETRRCVWRLS